ncbi:MAG: 4'-phosphopantetheinyl transferase superfamily protein [Paludibacter sp.]
MLNTKTEELSRSIVDPIFLVFEITESVEDLYKVWYYDGLDTKEFEKFVSEKRKREYLAVRLAMRSLLGKDVLICYTKEGKPFFNDNSFQISISHSGKWVAVMAHPTDIVGIDIECPTDKIKNLYTRFLSKTEQEELYNGNNIAQLQLAWSAKEALYKIIGKQAVDFAKQLRLFPFEVKPQGEIIAQHIESKTLYTLFYIQSAEYTLVYCRA